MRKYLRLSVVLVSLAAAALLEAAPSFIFDLAEFPSARLNALGGMHSALTDDISMLIANPAGFRADTPQLSVAELTANLSGPIFSIADLVMRVAQGTDDPLTLLSQPDVQDLMTSLYASAVLNGPLAFGYVGNGLGFGFFNSSGVSFATQGSLPTVNANVQEDILFVGGYAFRFPLPASWNSTLDLGVSIKAFLRGSVEVSESILSLFSLLVSPSPDILLGQPFALDVGFGVDTGILYTWNSVLSVAVVGRDLYAPVRKNSYPTVTAFTGGGTPTLSDGLAPIDLSAGILFAPRLGFLESYISGFRIMLDYGDILDFVTHQATARNPVLHLGLGIEAVLLDILSLRGGFGGGYFSAGLGLDLTVFRLNLTMYGSELSTEPGLRPAYNLLVGFEFRY